MTTLRAVLAAVALTAAGASAQPTLYAVDFPGNLYTVDQLTGTATLVAATGETRLNAAAADAGGNIYAARSRNPSDPNDANRLVRIALSGGATVIANYQTENDLRGLAFVGSQLYGIRDIGGVDDLVAIDTVTGAVTPVGPTSRGDVQGLTADGSGRLYALGIDGTGVLYEVDAGTGLATPLFTNIGGGGDLQAIEWLQGTDAVIARAGLRRVNLATGAVTPVGALGVPDVRGLAAVHSAPPCYPDCNADAALNLSDFGCFTTKFALGDPYADCNGDAVLNLSDFGCFTTKFALGCP